MAKAELTTEKSFSLRFVPAERDLVESAARRIGWNASTLIRRAAVAKARELLRPDLSFADVEKLTAEATDE